MRSKSRFFIGAAIVGVALLLLVPRFVQAHNSSSVPENTPVPIGSVGLLNTPGPISSNPPRPFQHVFVIVMENSSYSSLIGDANAPWITSAARTYGVATHYYAVTHPSQPNYLALTSGSTQGVTSDATETVHAFNLVDQLEARGKSWKAYMQSLFANGNTDKLASVAGDYARKHNPFVSYADIQLNPARMTNVVDFSQFAVDLRTNTVPDFAWISPDLCHDMHGHAALYLGDPCGNTEELVRQGDTFLRTTVAEIMHSREWSGNSAIFITWDESNFDDNSGCCQANPGGGHVLTLVISREHPASRISNAPYNHYSLLATIENGWDLGCLASTCDTAHVRPMNAIIDAHG